MKFQVEAEMYNQEALAENVYMITPKVFQYYISHRCNPNAVDMSRHPTTTQYIRDYHDLFIRDGQG